GLRLFQLGVFLDQLFQAESRKLYRNLRIFPVPLAFVHRAFAVLGMTDALSGPESSASGGLGNLNLGPRKLLPARGEELRNVVDGVVGRPAILAALRLVATVMRRALIFILVSVMPAGGGIASRRIRGPSRRSQVLEQSLGNFLQKPRGHAGLGHVSPVAAAIACAGKNQRVHGAGHADIAQSPLLFDVI